MVTEYKNLGLMDTAALTVMELLLKEKIANPNGHSDNLMPSPDEVAEKIAADAYRIGLAMEKESVNIVGKYKLVKI